MPRVEAHVTGLCYGVDNNSDSWKKMSYRFVRRHVLELLHETDDGRIITKVVEPDVYQMERALVGPNTNLVNEPNDWRPVTIPPRPNGRPSFKETIIAFPNKTPGAPVLWLQFPTISDFCKFYGYWNDNFRKKRTEDELMASSIRIFLQLKDKLSREQEGNQKKDGD